MHILRTNVSDSMQLHELKAKYVLEPWQDMSDHLRIHDSFKEFGERELQQGRFKST